MATEQVKTQFSSRDAITAILNAIKDGGLPIEDRLVLTGAVLREQQEQILHLRLHLRDESQVNALNTATLTWLKAAFEAVRNAGDLQAPIPVYADALRLYSPPQVYVPTDGGSHVEHAVGAGPRRRFGYQSNERGGPCDLCHEPTTEHGCPEVKE